VLASRSPTDESPSSREGIRPTSELGRPAARNPVRDRGAHERAAAACAIGARPGLEDAVPKPERCILLSNGRTQPDAELARADAPELAYHARHRGALDEPRNAVDGAGPLGLEVGAAARRPDLD
jgi:hypothetical protein